MPPADRRLLPLGAGLLTLVLLCPTAQARVYPVPILVDNEDELRLLVEDGVLEPDDFETLLELLSNPVDINRANRNQLYDLPGLSLKQAGDIVAYRKKNGPFSSVAELEKVPGITDAEVEQLFRFATAEPRAPAPKLEDVRGSFKARGSYHIEEREVTGGTPGSTNRIENLGYGELPQGYIAARAEHPWGVEAGFVGLATEGIVDAEYSPATRAIHATWGRPAFELGRLWSSIERGRYSAIAGHYTAGFGLGLTFDRTSRSRPQGWYPDMSVNTDTEDGDFSLPQTLFGVAGRVQDVGLGDWTMESTVFASSRRPDVYQYHIAVTGGDEVDPLGDELVSPRVFIGDDKVGYMTIPNAWRETLAGANVELTRKDLTRIGLTGYYAAADRTALEGVTDNTDWFIRQNVADEDRYGAFGLNIGQTLGGVDLAGEYARTLSGGNGVLLVALIDQGPAEIEASLRHYDLQYDNPHARGIAAADVYRGMRDRDEQGARLRAQVRPVKMLTTRAIADIWRNTSTGRTNLELFGRAQVDPERWLSVAVMADHRNRDLANNGRTRIYGGDYEEELLEAELDEEFTDPEQGDIIEGAGTRNWYAGQVRFDLIPETSLQLFYKRSYEDAGLVYPMDGEICEPWWQIGQQAWFKVRVTPLDPTVVIGRVRLVDEDVHGSLGDRFTDAYLQVQQKVTDTWKVTLRTGFLWYLEDPAAPWKETCDLAGRPDLEGACAVQIDNPAVEERRPMETLILATVEARFK